MHACLIDTHACMAGRHYNMHVFKHACMLTLDISSSKLAPSLAWPITSLSCLVLYNLDGGLVQKEASACNHKVSINGCMCSKIMHACKLNA